MNKTYAVRDEYAPRFGRQVLTVWSPPFASVFEAEAMALPRGDGYMVTTFDGSKIRVKCEAPRTEDNYLHIDEAISNTLNEWATKAGYTSLKDHA